MNTINRSHVFDNGLVLLYEEFDWSESFAIGVSTPAGSIWERPEIAGIASLTCEMTNRGAGQYDNRSFLEQFEDLGVRSSESASQQRSVFGATGLIDNWERSLELLALQIRQPQLAEEELESCRQIQEQEISSIEDEPAQKTGRALRNLFFPAPWGRSALGTIETVERITIDDVREFHRNYYCPNDAIIALTGRIDWDKAVEKVGELFGDWEPRELETVESNELGRSTEHLLCDSAQTHIGLAYKEIPYGNPDYWRMSGGIDVLSGGMSSRLFTEVREKRGLCYSVYAAHVSLKEYGGVFCYCGTTRERAQESLDVIVREIDRLSESPITSQELESLKIRAKSALVMQRESTQRRVGAMMSDWRHFKKVRSLDETLNTIASLTCETIEEYYAQRPNRKFRLVSCGGEALCLPEERLF